MTKRCAHHECDDGLAIATLVTWDGVSLSQPVFLGHTMMDELVLAYVGQYNVPLSMKFLALNDTVTRAHAMVLRILPCRIDGAPQHHSSYVCLDLHSFSGS